MTQIPRPAFETVIASRLRPAPRAGILPAMPRPPPPPDLPPGAPPPGRPPLGRDAALAGLAGLLGRLSGFARDVVFTATFGAGAATDAFFAAFRVPNLFRELLAEGTLTTVTVPALSEAEAKEGREGLLALINALLGWLLVVLGLVTLLLVVAADPFVQLVASGFASEPEKRALAVWLTRWMAPFLAGVSLASLLGAALNVRGRFFVPALGPALLNLLTIAACLGAGWWAAATGTAAIGAVAVATTVAGLLAALIQIPALRREGLALRPTLKRHPALGRVLRFTGAALVGILSVQFSLLVETQLASRMGDGPVSWLMLGFRLVQLPLSVVAGSVATATLPLLAGAMARGDRDGVRDGVSSALSLTSFLVVPAAVGLYVLAEPLTRLCFERGSFGPADTLATAEVLRMYALATPALCLHRVLLPAFFAMGDTAVPMRLSLAVMVAKLPLALLLTDVLGLGLAGLPLSHAITVSGEMIVMLALLSRRAGGGAVPVRELARTVAASAGMAAAVLALRPLSELFAGVGVLGVSGAGAAVYAALCLALGVREVDRVRAALLRRRPRP